MRRGPELLVFAARSHLVGALGIGIGGGLAMWILALGFVREMESFAGGPAQFGATVAAAAEPLRIMRWPAERLDTLGGYLTYHNVLLLPLLLGLYAAVQGAQALRGAEEKRVLDLWLATGRSRWSIVRDRAAGFALAMGVVTVGVAAGLAGGMAADGGDPQLGASLIVAAEASLAAMVFYALALLLSSFLRTSGVAAGVTVLAMIALYAATNISDRLGQLGAVRFASPFFYRQRSELLVPGHELDPVATLVLVLMFVALVALAGQAFVRRDYAATVWRRREAARAVANTAIAWRPTVWTASLAEQRAGLAGWALGTGVFMAAYATLIPSVEEIWERMGFIRALLATGPGDTRAQLTGFGIEVLGPVVAAFAIVQSARWARERTDGRDELLLAYPLSRTRYVLERLLGLMVGSVIVAAGGVAGLLIGGAAVGVSFDVGGLTRTGADLALLAAAVGAIGSFVVAVLGATAAVALLCAWLVTMYLLVLFAPLFDLPEWLPRLSLFSAFGNPYLTVPDGYGLTYLVMLAIGGAALAVAVLEHRRAA